MVARSSFLDEPTPFKTTAGLSLLTNKAYVPPRLGGYNLCYLRPAANLAAVTQDEYKAPVVAAWQSGAGRVLCYTGEVDGKYTGPIAQWKDAGDFFTSLARWTGGKNEALPAGVALVQERRKGITSVKLHLDPDRKQDPFTAPPAVTVLRATGDAKPGVEKTRLAWTGPDTLTVELPVHGAETLLATVDLPGHGPVSLSPVCLPYSPEYEPTPVRGSGEKKDGSESALRWGGPCLEHLSRMTGGRERIDLGGIWTDMPHAPHLVPLAPWLLVAAIVTLLLEVLERLTGALASGLRRSDAATGRGARCAGGRGGDGGLGSASVPTIAEPVVAAAGAFVETPAPSCAAADVGRSARYASQGEAAAEVSPLLTSGGAYRRFLSFLRDESACTKARKRDKPRRSSSGKRRTRSID